MTLPATGITAEVIREIMPPYHLSADLLRATVATLRAPPEASVAWYEARVGLAAQEISALMPANAAQAAMAADIVIARDMAKSLAARGLDMALTGPQMCRMFVVSGELQRTAGTLVRTLERTQQKPAPFFGTVLADAVDVAGVAAGWREGRPAGAGQAPPARETAPGTPADRTDGAVPVAPVPAAPAVVDPAPRAPAVAASAPGEIIPVEEIGKAPAMASMPLVADVTSIEDGARQGGSAEAAASVKTDARSTVEAVVTRLDEGPGWTLDVVRPRTNDAAGAAVVADAQ